MMTLKRLAPAILRQVAIFSDIEPKPFIMSSVIGFSENLRIEMAVPRSESGGMMTLTRLPSWRRGAAGGGGLLSAGAAFFYVGCGVLEEVSLAPDRVVGVVHFWALS